MAASIWRQPEASAACGFQQLLATQRPEGGWSPTLGRYDYVAPYALWDEPRQRLSSLTYRLYERSGHTPPYEEPEAFTADLLAWAADL